MSDVRKLVRNMRDPASVAYWEATVRTAARVATWPAWKRGVSVSEEQEMKKEPVVDARELNVMGQLYQHYKGPYYRRICNAIVLPSSMVRDFYTLAPILESDEKRSLLLGTATLRDSAQTFGPESTSLLSLYPALFVLNDRVREAYYSVVYLSLTYFTLWVRPFSEFHGVVPSLADPTVMVPRFVQDDAVVETTR